MKTLKVSTHTGKYNWANPSEISTNIEFVYSDTDKPDGRKLISLTSNDDMCLPDNGYIFVEEAVEIFEQWDKHIWISTSREDNKKFKEFLLENQFDIETGNRLSQIAEWGKQVAHLTEKIEQYKEWL